MKKVFKTIVAIFIVLFSMSGYESALAVMQEVESKEGNAARITELSMERIRLQKLRITHQQGIDERIQYQRNIDNEIIAIDAVIKELKSQDARRAKEKAELEKQQKKDKKGKKKNKK